MRYPCIFKDGCGAVVCAKKDILIHLHKVHGVKNEIEINEYKQKLKEIKPVFLCAEERDAYKGKSQKKVYTKLKGYPKVK